MDRFTAMETLGLGTDAGSAEIESAYRRRRFETEASLASAHEESEREAARTRLRDLEAAREALAARARARETPSAPQGAGSGPAPARAFEIDEGPAPRAVAPAPKPPAGPSERVLHAARIDEVPPQAARKRRLVIGLALGVATLGLALWAFLPSGTASDPASRKREAERARAQWQAIAEKTPGVASERATKDAAAAADALAQGERLASKGESEDAVEAYARARDRWRAAAPRGEVGAPRPPPPAAAAAGRRESAAPGLALLEGRSRPRPSAPE